MHSADGEEGTQQPGRDSLMAAHLQADLLLCISSSAGQGNSKLVIHRDVPEEVRHGLAIVDPPNCLGKNQADVHRLYLGTLQFLELMRDSVRHHHLITEQQRAQLLRCASKWLCRKAYLTFNLMPSARAPKQAFAPEGSL